MVDQDYTYATRSHAVSTDRGLEVGLATSGGNVGLRQVAHPFFFDGYVARPEQVAQALLLVARIARTRFYTPPNMIAAIIRAADPVVSSDGSRLRFESFSACCGVYARLDLLPRSLDAAVHLPGTTNVDFNADMRGVLARVSGADPLHLNVGSAVTATTLDGSATEEKVPLPDRWLKGFAEAQLAGLATTTTHEVPGAAARAFIRALPAKTLPSDPALAVVPAPTGLRLSMRHSAGAVRLGGAERLRCVEPVLRFAGAMKVHGSADGSSVWQFELQDARMMLALSPARSRGFSGEGGVLDALSSDEAAADAEALADLLTPRLSLPDLARTSGLSEERVRRALAFLGASGVVGYDVSEATYFHRELPLKAAEKMHPRIAGAKRLIERGAVTLLPGGGQVVSGEATYDVRDDGERTSCTCAWFAKHRLDRGPCKHLLAVRMA